MHRLLCTVGLGAALAFIAVPAAAQTIYVDVGVQAGPIGGRVVYGPPPVYPVGYPPYVTRYPVHDWEHAHRAARYEGKQAKRWRKAERKYYTRQSRLERKHAKMHREYGRQY